MYNLEIKRKEKSGSFASNSAWGFLAYHATIIVVQYIACLLLHQ